MDNVSGINDKTEVRQEKGGQPSKKKGSFFSNKLVVGLVGLVFLILVGLGGYYFMGKTGGKMIQPPPQGRTDQTTDVIVSDLPKSAEPNSKEEELFIGHDRRLIEKQLEFYFSQYNNFPEDLVPIYADIGISELEQDQVFNDIYKYHRDSDGQNYRLCVFEQGQQEACFNKDGEIIYN